MKKLLLLMLGVLIALPALARDFTYTYEEQTLTYTVIDEEAKTCKTKEGGYISYGTYRAGNNVSGTLVIPEIAIDGDTEYTVIKIGDYAFYYNAGMTSVTIPESVKTIGKHAFERCAGLRGELTIPESVQTIGEWAFRGCSGLTGELTIPGSVTSIGWCTFDGCSGLTSVTIPGSVTSIGSSAFSGCTALKSITIPNSVTSIGNSAFDGCSGLTSVTIGNSVETIGTDAFQGCTRLTSVSIPNSVETIGRAAFDGCTGLTSVTIGNSVKTIADATFRGCSGLTEVIIPPSVTSIGSDAFKSCSRLIKSAYPNTLSNPFPTGKAVSYNPGGAFVEDGIVFGKDKTSILYASIGLKGSYFIPGSVTSIGKFALYNCSGLTEVIIPPSVTSIGEEAFYGLANGLKKIAYPNTIGNPISTGIYVRVAYNPEGATIEDGIVFGKDKTSILYASISLKGEYVIPGSVEAIGESAFASCSGLTEVTIGNSVKSIPGAAFSGCTGLKSVTIGNSVETVGNDAFKNCSGLTKAEFASVESLCSIKFGTQYSNPLWYAHNLYIDGAEVTDLVIPESVASIGDYAFLGCTGLTEVIIPPSVTSIGEDAFKSCSRLIKSAYPNTISKDPFPSGLVVAYNPKGATIEDGVIFGKDKTSILYASIRLQGEFVIPGFVNEIGDEAFYWCDDLTSVTIPNSVKTIGSSAFEYCSGLTEVTIPESVTAIGSYAFSGCSALTELTIPESVSSIGNKAFNGCTALTEVIIPPSVTSIGSDAFKSCSRLIKSAYPNTLSKPFPSGTSVAYNPEGATIEDGVIFGKDKTSILYASIRLQGEFVIPETVTSIGSSAFYGCTGLTELTIPNSVKTIGSSAFEYCSGLTEVTIPESVTSIGTQAFSGCTALTEVKALPAIPPTMFDNSFEGLYDTANLEVSQESARAYLSSNWSLFKNINGIEHFTHSDDVLKYRLLPAGGNEGRNIAVVIAGDYSGEITVPERFAYTDSEGVSERYYVEGVGDNAFKGSSVTGLLFNSRIDLKYIGNSAFEGCKKLTAISVPNTVTSIGSKAFSGCTGLKSAAIGSSVRTIGDHAFEYCNALTKAEFASIESLCSIEFGNLHSNPLYYAEHLYIDGAEVTDIVIPETVTKIGNYVFYNCTGLKSVAIPGSVNEIGDQAFSYCRGLTELTIPNSVESIGSSAFEYCSGLTELTIPNSVESIGSKAFSYCSGLTEVKLEDGTAPIEFGNNSFEKTDKFSTLYLGRTISSASPFSTLSTLKTLTVGNAVTELPEAAFKGCTALGSLTLGSSLTDIGAEAFSGCTALKKVVVPPAVENIGASAFAGNSALDLIVMGHSVKTIGEKAFDGCPAKTVSITAQTPPQAPNNTFSNYSGKLYLQGADAVEAYYDALTCWDRFNGLVMVEATELRYDGDNNIIGNAGDTFQLKATLWPENVTLPQVFWRSTNPDIATVDPNGLVTLHADLKDIRSRAGDDLSCKIIAESLYADGPVLEVTVTSTPGSGDSGVDDITTDSTDNTIDYSAPYEVYNLSGMLMGTDLDGLRPAIYIVRQGSKAVKVAVK